MVGGAVDSREVLHSSSEVVMSFESILSDGNVGVLGLRSGLVGPLSGVISVLGLRCFSLAASLAMCVSSSQAADVCLP